MKKCFFLLFYVFILNGLSIFVGAQEPNLSSDKIWQEIDRAGLRQKSTQSPNIQKVYRTFALNKTTLKNLLDKTPLEFTASAVNAQMIMTLPMPDGTFARFSVEESPIMEPELAARFPEIKTYRGQGIDDPTATARFDFTPSGFHSMILSAAGTVLVDPYAKDDPDNYISYFKRDFVKGEGFVCRFGETIGDDFYKSDYDFFSGINSPAVISGSNLRTYRLALAATGEYTAAVGGTLGSAAQAQVSVMNRVNGIYERNLAIRMVLIANNHLLIYTNGATDPYTNNDGVAMLGQNQSNINNVITSANYDIGHVFSTGGGGVATLQSPCSSNKARGVTGLPNPFGDAFAVDYVAHEMGHQFGGNHTFNANDSNRSASSAYEPGSGITIMGYAGILGGQNLAANSIDTFHVRSLEEIIAFKETGGACGAATATGNTAPTVTAPGSFTIPKLTPFALTANATDINGDSITYDWQEYDLGAATNAVPNTDSDGVARPIFRPYLPTTSGTRIFPSLTYILNNANVPPNTTGGFLTGELLPAISRTMAFQVIARDNRVNGGGINTATTGVVVDGNSGPFAVTAPNTSVTWNANSTENITWSVANTSAAPVNAANVRILLSTDGGQTFPTVLANSTPNDGSETVTVPNVVTETARIKVEAVGNIFFDISNANFTIGSNCSYLINPTSASVASGSSVGNTIEVTTSENCSWSATSNAGWLNITSGLTGIGNGTVVYSVTANSDESRVGTITIAGQTFTVNQAAATLTAFNISGVVSYGTAPTVNVPGVSLSAIGSINNNASTDSAGAYSLVGLGADAYTVTPTKAAQVGNNGIALQDASEVAKYYFNQRTFTPNQIIAADATGNGSVSLQDASEIAKRAFNVPSANIVGQWKFAPDARAYPSLASNQTAQNYEAVLVGDVTGNWTPPINRPHSEETAEGEKGAKAFIENQPPPQFSDSLTENNQSADRQTNQPQSGQTTQTSDALLGGASINLPNRTGSAGTVVLIPVTIGDLTGRNETAYDFTVSFDPKILQPSSQAFDTAGTLTGAAASGYTVIVDRTQPTGKLRVGAFGATPLAGSGVLIYLRFNVLRGAAAATSRLDFERFVFGEGTTENTTTNGTFKRLRPPAAGDGGDIEAEDKPNQRFKQRWLSDNGSVSEINLTAIEPLLSFKLFQ